LSADDQPRPLGAIVLLSADEQQGSMLTRYTGFKIALLPRTRASVSSFSGK